MASTTPVWYVYGIVPWRSTSRRRRRGLDDAGVALEPCDDVAALVSARGRRGVRAVVAGAEHGRRRVDEPPRGRARPRADLGERPRRRRRRPAADVLAVQRGRPPCSECCASDRRSWRRRSQRVGAGTRVRVASLPRRRRIDGIDDRVQSSPRRAGEQGRRGVAGTAVSARAQARGRKEARNARRDAGDRRRDRRRARRPHHRRRQIADPARHRRGGDEGRWCSTPRSLSRPTV